MKYTEQDAKEAGIPLKLMNDWGHLMQELWSWAIKMRLPELKQVDGTISFRDGSIQVNFCNNKFLEVNLDSHEDKPNGSIISYVRLYYMGDPDSVKEIFSRVISDIIKSK